MKRSEAEIRALAEDMWDLLKRTHKYRNSEEKKAALLEEAKALEAEIGDDFEIVKLYALKLQFDRYNELKTW